MTKRTTVSTNEAAEALGVHPDTIANWIKSGKLRATKIGRRVLIRTDHIEAMLDANWKVSA